MPSLVALAACLVLAPQADPTALPDAEALLDRREATLGTPEARAAAKGVVVTGRIELPGTTMTGTFEELHLVGPERERVRIAIRMDLWGETTQGTDGVMSWSTDPGFGVMIREGVEAGGLRRAWAIQRSAPWRALYASARTLRAVERAGRALVELELAPKDGGPDANRERWLVDPASAELVRIAVAFPGPTGEVLPMGLVLEDWKAVDGVLYPHRLTQEVMSGAPGTEAGDAEPLMRIVTVRESLRHEALDPARLAPPADVLEALEDPSKRAPRPLPDPLVCSVEKVTAQAVASVRLECDATKVSETLAVVYGEVMGAVSSQGGEIVGPPFSRYHEIKDGKIDLEAGMPVKQAIEASGRVKPGELPAGRAAMTWHVGSYHELQQSYDRLSAWMKTEKLAPRGGFWETYWTDPGLEPDPSTWRTQIHWPVE